MADVPPTAAEVADALKRAGLMAVPLRVLQEAAVANALEDAGGNKTRAAAVLGVSVRTLQRGTKRGQHAS
jgi:transcriptional regulator with PAS, ATPase and Fis domain